MNSGIDSKIGWTYSSRIELGKNQCVDFFFWVSKELNYFMDQKASNELKSPNTQIVDFERVSFLGFFLSKFHQALIESE